MPSALISIVLPVYNGSRYLDESVQSCLAQTYTNWELIIVDDASTDDTPVRIVDYVQCDKRIRSIRHETNRKLPGALNTGFRSARGDYFTWTSDDNAYRPNALEEMLAFLRVNPAAAMVYADYAVIDESGRQKRLQPVGTPEANPCNNWVGACFLYKRQVHETIGEYATDLFLAEDYDFWLRAQAQFTLLPLHKDLYLYRDHASSLTQQRQYSVQQARVKVIERNRHIMPWLNHSLLCDFYAERAAEALAILDLPAARKYISRALCQRPVRPMRAKLAWQMSRTYSLRREPVLRLWHLFRSFLYDPRRLKGSCRALLRRLHSKIERQGLSDEGQRSRSKAR